MQPTNNFLGNTNRLACRGQYQEAEKARLEDFAVPLSRNFASVDQLFAHHTSWVQTVCSKILYIKLALSSVKKLSLGEVGTLWIDVYEKEGNQSASRLPMKRVPPKVWLGPTCLQWWPARHAPPATPPTPFQPSKTYSVSHQPWRQEQTFQESSSENLRSSPHEPGHSSDKSRVEELSVRRSPVKPGTRISLFLRSVQETGNRKWGQVRQDTR